MDWEIIIHGETAHLRTYVSIGKQTVIRAEIDRKLDGNWSWTVSCADLNSTLIGDTCTLAQCLITAEQSVWLLMTKATNKEIFK